MGEFVSKIEDRRGIKYTAQVQVVSLAWINLIFQKPQYCVKWCSNEQNQNLQVIWTLYENCQEKEPKVNQLTIDEAAGEFAQFPVISKTLYAVLFKKINPACTCM